MSRLAIRWARDLEAVGPAARPEGHPLSTLLLADRWFALGAAAWHRAEGGESAATRLPSPMNPQPRSRHGRTPCA
jgi:hypothetical protein